MSQAALELLDEVLPRIARAYQRAFDEPPTLADLSALLSAALGDFFDAPVRVTLHPPGRGPVLVPTKPASLEPEPSEPEAEGPSPRVGDILALELEDGRFGVARILRVTKGGYVLEALDGVFEALPTLDQAVALERLREDRGHYEGHALVRHAGDEPPASARLVGRQLPSLADYREEPRIYEEWSSVTGEILGAWRRRRDRENLERN